MHAAAPVDAPDGVRLAPPLHRLGPLFGHVVLCEPLQSANELAVDDPRRERIEVAGSDRHSHLVEQFEPRLDLAAQDEEPRFCHPSDRARCRITPRADLDRTHGPLSSSVEVADQHSLVRADCRNPRIRRRFVVALEQLLRASQPAAHRCHQGGIEQQVHRDANRRLRCRDLVADPHGHRVSAFPRLDRHVEMARCVGNLAENR